VYIILFTAFALRIDEKKLNNFYGEIDDDVVSEKSKA